jgi:hypothetical protein
MRAVVFEALYVGTLPEDFVSLQVSLAQQRAVVAPPAIQTSGRCNVHELYSRLRGFEGHVVHAILTT